MVVEAEPGGLGLRWGHAVYVADGATRRKQETPGPTKAIRGFLGEGSGTYSR